MGAYSCVHTLKSLPCWVIGSQYRTPMFYPVMPLFIVPFLQGCKVLVWPTLLLSEWKSLPLKIAGLSLVTGANAPAWDPSCSNRNSFNGPDTAAKIADGFPLGENAFKHQTHCRGFVLCLLTGQTQRQEHFSHVTILQGNSTCMSSWGTQKHICSKSACFESC